MTEENDLLCLDAKMNFDDNSIFRHPEILELRDLNEEDPAEIEASKYDLHIKLDEVLYGERSWFSYGNNGYY